MTRKVLAYQAPAQLLRSDSIFQKQYKDCLHIVATNSLKKGVGESIRNVRWIDAPIITFSELFEELSGDKWSSSKSQLKQFLHLSEVFSELWDKDDVSDILSLQSIERNQMQVLKTLRMLTELGVRPNDIINYKRNNKLTNSERFFLQIWSEMEDVLTENSHELSKFINGKKNIKKYIESCLKKWGESFNRDREDKLQNAKRRTSNLPRKKIQSTVKASLKKRKIILHGFYFITPIQERIFNRLEDHFELVFLNPYDERLPNTFEAVQRFLGTDKFQLNRVVEDYVALNPIAAKLVESFEGGSDINIDIKASVYNDLPHFVEGEKLKQQATSNEEETDDTYHIYTPRATEVEDQLIANGFIVSNDQKLTDFPVGRFLYRLHNMKVKENNLNTGEVVFREKVSDEAIVDCFSSGCLIVNGEDMRKYSKQLEKVIPYCKGVSTFEEWHSKITELYNEKVKWEQVALEKNPKALSNQIHKFYSLPMRQLSYFSVSKEDIQKILKGIYALQNIHEKLFSDWDSKKVNISHHLNSLQEHVLNNIEEHSDDEEKKIVNNLLKEIASLEDEEVEFSLKDIAQGLMFYLDGTLNEVENQEVIPESICSLEHSDGAPFLNNRKFHLAFADHKSLPITQGYNMWPISGELMEHLEQIVPELELLEMRKKQSSSITRYLLFELLKSADDVRFSYAKHLGKESRLELPLYLKLLGCEKKHEDRLIQEYDAKEVKLEPEHVDVDNYNWTETMKLEGKVCGKRAAFSFILNEHTTFNSDFHHGFLYQNLMEFWEEIVENTTSSDNEKKIKADRWFPQWNQFKRDFLFESKINNRNFKRTPIEFNSRKYSQANNYLQLLPNSYSDLKPDDVNQEKEVVLYKANPGKHCKYCPHIDLCKEGIYSIAQENQKTYTSSSSTNSNENNKKNQQTKKDKTTNSNSKGFSLLNYLKSKDLTVIDKREKNGCLWIVGGEELSPDIEELRRMNIHFKFAENGSKSTKKQPAWFSRYPK